jgi:Ca2+-dependent lipid-binding protein
MFASTSEAVPTFPVERRTRSTLTPTSQREEEATPPSTPLKLSITIEKCSNLKSAGITGTNAFVFIYDVTRDREEGQKTQVVRKSQNPVYNETFQFTVERTMPFIASFRIEVTDDGVLKKDLGSADLSIASHMSSMVDGQNYLLQVPLNGGPTNSSISLVLNAKGLRSAKC